MKIIDDILSFIFSLDSKRFLIYLGIITITLALSATALLYFIHAKSTTLINNIKLLQKLNEESKILIATYDTIQTRKEAVFDLLEKEKNFDLKSFFATFSKENNLKIESPWTTIAETVEGNELLEEISLPITMPHITMQQLVHFLETFKQKERVYIKNLTLTKETEPPFLITCSFTIATLKYRITQGE